MLQPPSVAVPRKVSQPPRVEEPLAREAELDALSRAPPASNRALERARRRRVGRLVLFRLCRYRRRRQAGCRAALQHRTALGGGGGRGAGAWAAASGPARERAKRAKLLAREAEGQNVLLVDIAAPLASVMAAFHPKLSVKTVRSSLGRHVGYDVGTSFTDLQMTPRSIDSTLLDGLDSLP